MFNYFKVKEQKPKFFAISKVKYLSYEGFNLCLLQIRKNSQEDL